MQTHLFKKPTRFLISALLLLSVMIPSASPVLCEQPPPQVTDVDDPEGRMLYSAGDAWNSGNKREAMRLLTKVLEENPTQYVALVERATAYFESKNYKKATCDLRRAEECETNAEVLSTARAWRAYIYMRHGKFKKAAELLDDAIRDCPDHPDYFFARGVVAQEQKNFVLALQNYDLALKELDKNPEFQKKVRVPALFNKSICQRRLGRYEESATSIKLACELSPALEHRKEMYQAPLKPFYMISMTGFEMKFGFPEQNQVWRTVY